MFSVIAAKLDKPNGIGVNGGLPWTLPSDLHMFQKLTAEKRFIDNAPRKNAVVMGRKTWESLPMKKRPLPNRINVVISSSLTSAKVPESVHVFATLNKALDCLQRDLYCADIFVIGGARLYQEAIHHPCCETLYLTNITCIRIDPPVCDTFFPEIPKEYTLTGTPKQWEDSEYQLELQVWKRVVS